MPSVSTFVSPPLKYLWEMPYVSKMSVAAKQETMCAPINQFALWHTSVELYGAKLIKKNN